MSVRRTAFWATLASGTCALAVAFGTTALVPVGWSEGALGSLLPWLLGMTVAALTATVAAVRVGRSLAERLSRLGEMAEALAREPSTRAVEVRDGDAEVVRLYRAFAVLSRSMHELLERERSFARYASHELRTPVGALKVQVERVELGTATAADVLPAVARQTARIEELIDALLALARSRERGSRVRPLPALLQEAVETLSEAERSRVYFVEPVPDLAVRESVLVSQALRNLIDNAVRHGAGPVTVRVKHAADTLTVRVRDMGTGIPGTELRRLAEPADRRRPRADGHGLGLTLVALIARALDGRLHLHNTDTGLEASIVLRAIVRAS